MEQKTDVHDNFFAKKKVKWKFSKKFQTMKKTLANQDFATKLFQKMDKTYFPDNPVDY